MEPETLLPRLLVRFGSTVKLSCNCAVSLAACAFLLCCIGQVAQAQGKHGLQIRFATPDTINVTAGTQITFELIARTATGEVDTNWDQSGVYDTLRILNTTAETDSSRSSWNSHPEAYSWLMVAKMGMPLQRGRAHEFLVTPLSFEKGILSLKFISTKAERNVRIQILPAHDSITSISPCINIVPGPPNNFLVDMTEADARQPLRYFVNRPVELVVTPRDYYLNAIADSTPVRFLMQFGFELDSIPGLPNLHAKDIYLHGPGRFYLRPRLPRLPSSTGIGQILTAYLPGRWDILGVGEPFYYDIHPPNPFALTTPVDRFDLTLRQPGTMERFFWAKPSPPDPYTGIRVFSASHDLAEDTLRYTIHFLDAATRTREYVLVSDDDGLTPAVSISHSVLANIIDSLSGIPDVPSLEVIWYVEATDGDWVTRSSSAGADSSGRSLKLTNGMYADKAVALHIPTPGPFTLDVGDEFCFELQAQDLAHTIVSDWDAMGRDVTLLIRGSTVDSDSSTRAWGADTLGYSWSRLTVAGKVLQPVKPGEYLIPTSLFNNGRAAACYRSSKAEKNILIEISPLKTGWIQQSPDISWESGGVDNLFVDITWPSVDPPGVYVQRPYEVILHARDRYLNTVAEAVPVRLDIRFRNEIVLSDTSAQPPDSLLTLNGTRTLYLLSTSERGPDTASGYRQEIAISHATDTTVFSGRLSFFVLGHQPYPFALQLPADNTWLNIERFSSGETFTWQRRVPPDPYTDIPVARSPLLTASDDLIYHVFFVDAATMTNGISLLSDEEGRSPQLSRDGRQLLDILARVAASTSTRSVDVIWYVEVTDGLYTIRSNTPSSMLPGYRLRLVDRVSVGVEQSIPRDVALSQNYPNPFNPATTIRFSTPARGDVSLKVFDLLGGEVATLHEGPLEAGGHVRSFDAAGLNSGVYVYRLRVDDKLLSRCMVYMK